jgi:hypothetical protein
MKRTSIVLLAVAGLSLAACSSPKVGVNNTATTGAGSQTTGTTKTTSAAASTTGTVSPLLTGTAHPTIPALVPGKVAIIETGPASGSAGTTVPVVVGNGTIGTISHIEVAGPAVDSTGKVVGSGDSQGFEPVNLAAGQVAFGFAYFSESLPAGVNFQFKVTYQDGASSTQLNVQVTQANAGTDPNLPSVVGAVTNSGKVTVKSPIEANVYCFDATGAFVAAEGGFTDGNADLTPGVVASYSVDLGEQACPTFLVGSSAHTF